MIRDLWKWYLTFFDDLNSAQGRELAIAALGTPPAIGLHLVFLLIFAYWGVWPLTIFNFFSTLLFGGLLFIILRFGYMRLAYILSVAEVMVHGFLVIHFIGWGFGTQYHLLYNMVFLLVAPVSYSIKAKVGFASLTTITFIFYYYYSVSFSPLYSVPPIQLAIINAVNIFAAFS